MAEQQVVYQEVSEVSTGTRMIAVISLVTMLVGTIVVIVGAFMTFSVGVALMVSGALMIVIALLFAYNS